MASDFARRCVPPNHPPRLTLVTGPARSGKSAFAERLAAQQLHPVTYIATGQTNPDDPEWQQRIRQHRDRRPAHWTTCEIPVEWEPAIATATATSCFLLDSLGTWTANCLDDTDEAWDRRTRAALQALAASPAHIVVVAEAVGWGVVPAYELGRLFRDRLGELCQALGAIADAVFLVSCGYALDLKQLGQPIVDRSL